MDSLKVGDKIRNFRLSAAFSQFDLEIATNASAGSISRIEAGQVNPTKETLLKIANALNLGFDERVELMGIEYSEAEKYIPSNLLGQRINKNTSLKDIINTNFFEYAFLKGKDYFINECDSDLQIPTNEVLYIQNICNWRKVYSEDAANAQHVPKRMEMKKFARFLINSCEQANNFKKQDYKFYRESRLINTTSNFDYTLMIDKSRITVFMADPNITTFTIKNNNVADRARTFFNKMWEENKP